jgi:hypothetical protein
VSDLELQDTSLSGFVSFTSATFEGSNSLRNVSLPTTVSFSGIVITGSLEVDLVRSRAESIFRETATFDFSRMRIANGGSLNMKVFSENAFDSPFMCVEPEVDGSWRLVLQHESREVVPFMIPAAKISAAGVVSILTLGATPETGIYTSIIAGDWSIADGGRVGIERGLVGTALQWINPKPEPGAVIDLTWWPGD